LVCAAVAVDHPEGARDGATDHQHDGSHGRERPPLAPPMDPALNPVEEFRHLSLSGDRSKQLGHV
jgi:hypothetical protein